MIEIPACNWHMALADAIETAPDGETIKCRTRAEAELGERARMRMCPSKKLSFVYDIDDLQSEPE